MTRKIFLYISECNGELKQEKQDSQLAAKLARYLLTDNCF